MVERQNLKRGSIVTTFVEQPRRLDDAKARRLTDLHRRDETRVTPAPGLGSRYVTTLRFSSTQLVLIHRPPTVRRCRRDSREHGLGRLGTSPSLHRNRRAGPRCVVGRPELLGGHAHRIESGQERGLLRRRQTGLSRPRTAVARARGRRHSSAQQWPSPAPRARSLPKRSDKGVREGHHREEQAARPHTR